MKNYYHTLGLSLGAKFIEIKKAYRTLAFQFHPDKNSENNPIQKFYEITEAYEVLSDNSARVEYDSMLKEYLRKNQKLNPDNPEISSEKSWSEFGRQKAKEYSEMPYEAFTNRIRNEIKIGTK